MGRVCLKLFPDNPTKAVANDDDDTAVTLELEAGDHILAPIKSNDDE